MDLAVSDSAPVAGGLFTIAATVRNAGGAAAEATTLRYYRSTDARITKADTEVGTDAVAEIAASEAGGESAEVSAPSTPGTYYYGACVDAVANESNLTNNCSASERITVRERQDDDDDPDLVVLAASVSDSAPAAGATFTLSAAVRNTEGGFADVATLRYYRSTDATIKTADTEVATDQVTGLAGAGSAGRSVELTAPSTPGTYYYGACVDPLANESDLTNNCSTSVQVTVRAQARESQGTPDLVVTSPSVSDSGPAAGASFTLSATARNDGDGAAPATTLRFFQSVNATITTAGTQVGTSAIVRLAASGSAGGSVDLTAPAWPGAYHYGACVDAVAGESDKTNNCSSAATVTVPKPQYPDLIVALKAGGAPHHPGSTLILSAMVINTGAGESPWTTLGYYQSTDATITTSDTSVGTDAVETLAASGDSAQWILLTAPSSLGAYYYGACVETVTDESDTTNNCSSAVQVNVQAWKPDLLMSNLRVDLTDPVTGETFTLSADVLNGTRAPSAATTLRYYRSADSTITTSDTEVGTDAVDALSAYGSSAESISLTAPATTGAYYYGACVDAVAGESDTTNNCSVSVKVDVVAQQRRVDISPRTLTFEAVGDSETVTVRVLDENGDEDTEASYGWISFSPFPGPCCTLKKVDDGLEVTVTQSGRMSVDLFSTDAKSARLQVTAYQKATTLEVSPSSVSLEVDETDTLSATIKDANGHAIEGLTVYWTTSDSDVATVQGADDGGATGATATVTAAATGMAMITARHAAEIGGTAAVTVTSSNEQ
ncbi:MAG: Ig-like domain-containing protein [Spirochaetaceae bacterium]|nr:Ig-like domain-containing protein [Spirochaetaceae bacterium]